MAKARRWRDVRAEATAAGRVTENGVAEARRQHEDRIHAYRLRQARQARAARQEDVAREMHVSQSRVSRIESGDLEHVELATLRAYARALGGELRIEVDFGDERLEVA